MVDGRFELEFKYAWDWFSYHARQRLMAFNFFLVLIGAVVVGYTQAVNEHIRALGVGLGFLGAFVSVGFWVMDVRNEELVNCGRAALDKMEKQLRLTIREDDHKRVRLPEALQGPAGTRIRQYLAPSIFTHRTWLRAVITGMGLLSAIAGLWALIGFPGAH